MTKDEYVTLPLPKKAAYINAQLAGGISVNAMAKDLGMSESTFRKSITNHGYVRDKVTNQFIFMETGEQSEDEAQNEPQPISTADTPLHQNEVIPTATDNQDFVTLSARVTALEQVLAEALAKANKSQRIVIDLPEDSGEVRNTFRLNGEVFRQWQELQKRYPGVTAKDLMSQALWEYINRHEVD